MSSIGIGITYFSFFLLFLFCFLFESIRIQNISEDKISRDSITYVSLYILFLIFFVFIGLRGFVNTDWKSYKYVFDNISNLEESETFEVGFMVLMRISRFLSDDYTIFVVLSSLIDLFLFYKAFKSEKSIFLVFIFYYLFCGSGCGFRTEFNLMRNIKSILIFCISLKYVYERKFFKYLILNLIGMLFHSTSIIYIPLYFILNKRYPRKFLLFIFGIGNLIFLLQIQWVQDILAFLSSFLPGALGQLISKYLSVSVFANAYGITIGYLERFFTFLLAYIFYKKCDESEIVYFNILFIYLFIYLFCSEMLILLSRFALLFIVGYWFVLPKIYFKLNRDYKIVFLIFIVFYAMSKYVLPYNDVIFYYDNMIFNPLSETERLNNLRKLELRGL